uniref:Uncharacterized protein n=1 Tax=Anguilla anguilla TaxID=7936 RepID=A0A0E9T684_ANGAN
MSQNGGCSFEPACVLFQAFIVLIQGSGQTSGHAELPEKIKCNFGVWAHCITA